MSDHKIICISVIVPVFKGEACLNQLINEIEPLTHSQFYTSSMNFRISEVLLVHDCGPDNSDIIIEELSFRHKFFYTVRSLFKFHRIISRASAFAYRNFPLPPLQNVNKSIATLTGKKITDIRPFKKL